MSLDMIVWLGCAASLPQALPEPARWTHYQTSMPKIEGLPPAVAAQLANIEGWQFSSETTLIHASYASRNPLTFEDLKTIAPEIPVVTSPAVPPATASAPISAEEAGQAALKAQARDAKVGISLVLEGVNPQSYDDLGMVIFHLVTTCGGAIVEAPDGFQRLDAQGQPAP